MMYQAYQAQADLMWPLRTMARHAAPMFQAPAFAMVGLGQARPMTEHMTRQMAAACKVLELAEVTHKARPGTSTACR